MSNGDDFFGTVNERLVENFERSLAKEFGAENHAEILGMLLTPGSGYAEFSGLDFGRTPSALLRVATSMIAPLNARWYLRRVGLIEVSRKSPLEYVMAHALALAAELITLFPIAYASCSSGIHRESSSMYPEFASICGQHRIEPYLLDFLVTGHNKSGETRSVAVEVDGHEFHDRTKAQASHDRRRDRMVQAAGYKVFRYPGSEVYCDPLRCAREVVRMALGRDEPVGKGR